MYFVQGTFLMYPAQSKRVNKRELRKIEKMALQNRTAEIIREHKVPR